MASSKKQTVYRWTSSPDDEWNKEVFIKQGEELVSVGRQFDYKYLPHGCFYVENNARRGWRRIKAMPRHLELESAIDDCREQLIVHLQRYHKKLYESGEPYSYSDMADAVSNAVRATIHDRQMDIIRRLKQ